MNPRQFPDILCCESLNHFVKKKVPKHVLEQSTRCMYYTSVTVLGGNMHHSKFSSLCPGLYTPCLFAQLRVVPPHICPGLTILTHVLTHTTHHVIHALTVMITQAVSSSSLMLFIFPQTIQDDRQKQGQKLRNKSVFLLWWSPTAYISGGAESETLLVYRNTLIYTENQLQLLLGTTNLTV